MIKKRGVCLSFLIYDEFMSVDWKSLVEGVKKNDESSMHSFIENTQTPLLHFCVFITGQSQLAEDLCHDTLVKAFTSIHQLKKPERCMAWLKKIARHLYLDYIKSAAQSRPHLSMDDEFCSIELEAKSGISEDQIDTLTLLHRLKEEDRVLLTLIDIQGCSYQEVSQVLEIAEGTVKSRLFRAREKMAQLFHGTKPKVHSS